MLIPAEMPLALLIAIAVDAILGDPKWLYRRPGHPVEWLGAVIAWADRRFNRENDMNATRRRAGALLAAAIVLGSVAIGWILQGILLALPAGFFWLGLAMSSLIAGRSLREHVVAVLRPLETDDLDGARIRVRDIVGRDTATLDEAGVSRAAIESLAENFSDGVVAPVFWALVLGLPGLLAYKALNTADSMIGHKTARHLDFGRASARLDDLANAIPARLSGLAIVAAAHFLSGAQARAAWRAMWRDAPFHRSPNAGWPEAAMAGALGLALAGPRRYEGREGEDCWMGAGGNPEARARDIARALSLFDRAWLVLAGALGVVAWLMH